MGQWAEIFWVEQVVLHGTGLRIGYVLEHIWRRDIAKRPNALGGGSAELVGAHAGVGKQLNACLVQIHLIAVWGAPGSNENRFCFHGLTIVELQPHSIVGLFELGAIGYAHVEAITGNLVEAPGNVIIEVAQ